MDVYGYKHLLSTQSLLSDKVGLRCRFCSDFSRARRAEINIVSSLNANCRSAKCYTPLKLLTS